MLLSVKLFSLGFKLFDPSLVHAVVDLVLPQILGDNRLIHNAEIQINLVALSTGKQTFFLVAFRFLPE